MIDIPIGDTPDAVVAAIDARAQRLGLSRPEYLRRALARKNVGSDGPVTFEHFQRVASQAGDLADAGVLTNASS